MDCAVQCFSSSDDAATLIIFAGSWSHILSTMTSTCVLIMASPRARCSTSSVHVRRFGCTAGKFDSNEVRTPPAFLAATRCGADVMRLRCGCDATAMRRRCDGDATAQTAMQLRRNRRRNRRGNRRGNRRRNRRSMRRYFCKNTER